jgi:two-component system, sensor histidine kinase
MVIYGLLLGIGMAAVLLPFYLAKPANVVAIRTGVILLLFLAMLKYMLYKPVWRPVVHVVLLVLTYLIWSNTFQVGKGISVITIQYAFMVVIFSFYGFGARYGFLYSVVNVGQLLLFAVLFTGDKAVILLPDVAARPAFLIGLSFNFVIIIFAHYHFFVAFQRAISELGLASQAKSDFLSTMSHELRTPLNSVIGMANLLEPAASGTDQQENLKILKFSAENLMGQINDLLDFNKLESNKIRLDRIDFDLLSLVRETCSSFRERARQKGVHFSLEADPLLNGVIIYGDPARLAQVLHNLLANALKFTPAGQIRLTVEAGKEDSTGVQVQIAVEDTGIGISPAKLREIFLPFTQASSRSTRTYGGTGLGLAIVRHLLALHGSEIAVKSEEGKGSVFSFALTCPIARRQAAPIQNVRADTAGETRPVDMTILVAEDNDLNVLLLKKLLKNWWGLEPLIAGNGEIALEYVRNREVDVILMDLHMPVMDGYEATKTIRTLGSGKSSVPIFALTASVSGDIDEKRRMYGFDDYIQKPFDPAYLRGKLESVYLNKIKNTRFAGL